MRTLIAIVLVFSALTLLPGCDEETARSTHAVELDGRWFHLELALDHQARVKGLSGRDFIADDGGMLFVFPNPGVQQFVMRDCLVPIDIIFLDGAGRVTAKHKMTVEDDQTENESDLEYESRLKRYSSRFAAQFVIEIKGGLLDELDIKNGQRIDLDLNALKRQAR
ncbi:MAG: DUF192 domain-containing protein [Planctomycetota bacterium]